MARPWVRNAGTSALVAAVAGAGMAASAGIASLEARLHAAQKQAIAARHSPPPAVVPVASPSPSESRTPPLIAARPPGQQAQLAATQQPTRSPRTSPSPLPHSPSPGPSASPTALPTPSPRPTPGPRVRCAVNVHAVLLDVQACIGS